MKLTMKLKKEIIHLNYVFWSKAHPTLIEYIGKVNNRMKMMSKRMSKILEEQIKKSSN